ncbi:MAG: DUF3080 family protein [Pseudomonadota bacterium]
MPGARRFGLRGLAFLGSLLGGCGASDLDGTLRNYLTRLSRPLGMEAPAPRETKQLQAPRAEALRLDFEDSALDGLDFLKLKGCALQTTVARRNSSLGRVAPPSQRLLLDLAFLRDAPACSETLAERDENRLATFIAQVARQKRDQLPRRIFNATLGGLEYRDFWRSGVPRGSYPEDTSSAVMTALEQITANAERWLDGDFSADDRDFELALGTIGQGDGGELLWSLGRQAAWLESANGVIEHRLERGELCRAGMRPNAAPILRTVVSKYFIGEVQPSSAALAQRYHGLLPPIAALETRLKDVLPEPYVAWQRQRDASLAWARAAPATHVRRLQALLGPCYAEFSPEDPDDAY